MDKVEVTQADRDAIEAVDDALGFLTDPERKILLEAFARHRIASAPSAKPSADDEQIKHMANRFLRWKLPKPFRPDHRISFDPPASLNPGTPYENDLWPIGTNLFGAPEAEAMVRHMVEGLPVHTAQTTGWIVADGAGDQWRAWGQIGPYWTKDRDKATRYARREDAESVHAEDEDAWFVQPYTHPAEQFAESTNCSPGDIVEGLVAENEVLKAEVKRLRKLLAPQWFYADGYSSEECTDTPDEVLECLDLKPGEHVVRIDCVGAMTSIWCAVHVPTDEEMDEQKTDDRLIFTEHSTEADARAALAAAKEAGL